MFNYDIHVNECKEILSDSLSVNVYICKFICTYLELRIGILQKVAIPTYFMRKYDCKHHFSQTIIFEE